MVGVFMSNYAIKTERLILRPCREDDLEPFVRLRVPKFSIYGWILMKGRTSLQTPTMIIC
jgi:hypothetical protein